MCPAGAGGIAAGNCSRIERETDCRSNENAKKTSVVGQCSRRKELFAERSVRDVSENNSNCLSLQK